MSTIKQDVVDAIQRLSDDCTIEDVLYLVMLRVKIEQGRRAIEEGRTFSTQEVEQILKATEKSKDGIKNLPQYLRDRLIFGMCPEWGSDETP